MMGEHNPDLKRGLDSVFECMHFDWTPFQNRIGHLQEQILSMCELFEPAIIFMHIQSEGIVLPETLSKLIKSSMIFSWTGDVRHPLPQHYIDTGRLITSTLFSNQTDVEIARPLGITADYLQVGFDKEHFSPLGRIGTGYSDIIFLGTNYLSHPFPLSSLRHAMCIRLKHEFGGAFQIYGDGWSGMANGLIHKYEEEGAAYRACKIAINLSHFAYSRYSSDRMFRILGTGAFCLTHRFPDIEQDFDVGNELVVWEDLDDLVRKCEYYLANPVERERIALNGCFKARTEYTWNHFASNLSQIAEIHKQTKKPAIENEQPA
jgi:spore maturation protein CgeB